MSTLPKTSTASLIPCLRYRDAPAAIAWLCQVFGFEKQLVVSNDDGSVAHAQLGFGNGNGMVMLASVFETQFGRLIKPPEQIGGANTQSCYLIVSDADLVYQRAAAAGAAIVLDIRDQDYGGRGFTCRDPEGHLWSVGTYDPW